MTVLEAVNKQFEEEIGDQEEHPISGKEKYQLRMKYGLSAVRLTSSGRYLINKEEKELNTYGFSPSGFNSA